MSDFRMASNEPTLTDIVKLAKDAFSALDTPGVHRCRWCGGCGDWVDWEDSKHNSHGVVKCPECKGQGFVTDYDISLQQQGYR